MSVSHNYKKDAMYSNTEIKYAETVFTYGRSVREGAVNTMPQVPQNCAYGLFIALHFVQAKAYAGDI